MPKGKIGESLNKTQVKLDPLDTTLEVTTDVSVGKPGALAGKEALPIDRPSLPVAALKMASHEGPLKRKQPVIKRALLDRGPIAQLKTRANAARPVVPREPRAILGVIDQEVGRDLKEASALAAKLFGPNNHFNSSVSWHKLRHQLLDLFNRHHIQLQSPVVSSVFDELQSLAIPCGGFLTPTDLLSFLRMVNRTFSFSGQVSQALVNGIKQAQAPEKLLITTVNSERLDLSLTVEKISRQITGHTRINEYLSRDELEENLASYSVGLPVEDWARVIAILSTYKDESPAIDRLRALSQALKTVTQLVTDHSFDGVANTQFVLVKGAQIGQGGFGLVYDATLNGVNKVLKEFKGKTYPLQLDLTNPPDPSLRRSIEATASYLQASELDTIIAPTHYLVSEKCADKPELIYSVEVIDKQFRAWAKHKLISNQSVAGYALEIIGSLQNYAKGMELSKYLETSAVLDIEANARAVTTSYLDALKVLCKRGFVHGDLKLRNAFYDASKRKISLIDTGGLTKISKDEDRKTDTEFHHERGITPAYSIPNVLRQKKVGFEQDLFSVGAQILEIIGKTHFPNATRCADLRSNMRAAYGQVLAHKKPLYQAEQEILEVGMQTLKAIVSKSALQEHEELELIALLALVAPILSPYALTDRDTQLSFLEDLKGNPKALAKILLPAAI